jgi:hypothetical protein
MEVLFDAVRHAYLVRRRGLVLLTGTAIAAVLALAAALPAAPATAAATCSHLTKAQIQPLLVHHVTKLTITPVPGLTYGISAKQVGQTCIFADTEGSNAFTVKVIVGPAAARAYKSELHGLAPGSGFGSIDNRKLAQVAVVSGGKGVRSRADSRGSVGTAEVVSINGSTFCAVIPTDDEIPGVARLEKAAGYTADIGDKAYADIAAAIGTVCNRIYRHGSTNPASALAALQKITPKHGGGDGGGITVPTLPTP